MTLRTRFAELSDGPPPSTLQEAFAGIPEWRGMAIPGLVSMEGSLYCQYRVALARVRAVTGRASADRVEGRVDTLGVSEASGEPVTVGC